ncbi:MAG: amidohydrolase family protein [Sphaerochaetaceae bacterium]|nr:amidohydrolase family protein [Sphaerochaetaceae bacterium]
MKADLIIEGATIVDGVSAEPYKGNVAVSGDTIVRIDEGPESSDARRTIDARGKILIPGVIDVHSHSDLLHLKSVPFTHKITMGVTSEIVGNCGIGPFPSLPGFPVPALNIDVLGDDRQFASLAQYRHALRESYPSNNVGSLQPHAPLRRAVMKEDIRRGATRQEIAQMVHLLEKSFGEGAAGFSTGLYYDPCLYASHDELTALLKATAQSGKIFSVHHRREGDGVLDSLGEVIDLAKKTKVQLQISHLKAIGQRNQQYVPRMLKMITRAAEDGVDIHFDQYPYEWGATSLSSLLPPSVLALPQAEWKALAADKGRREDIIWEIEHPDGYDSIISLCSFDRITLLSYEADPSLESKTISEIASMWNMNGYDAFFNLVSESAGGALMSDITQSQTSLEMIMLHPLGMFCTDSIYSGKHLHPRSLSAVTDLFDRFYRRKRVLDLAGHVRRMCVLPSQTFHLEKRGMIKSGYKGDMVLLDFPEDGSRRSSIEQVIINGEIAYDNGKVSENYTTCFL